MSEIFNKLLTCEKIADTSFKSEKYKNMWNFKILKNWFFFSKYTNEESEHTNILNVWKVFESM